MTPFDRLTLLREKMKEQNIDAYIIASADPHMSEYLPDRYKNMEWLSGFTGSAGTLAITANFAGLWTDSRYFVQAGDQLKDTGFELVKLKNQGAPEYIDWLAQQLNEGSTLGFDGKLMSIAIANQAIEAMKSKNIQVNAAIDLIDEIWTDRPSLPSEPAYLIDEETTGKSITNKIAEVKAALRTKGATAHLISSLDDISWVFNLRGSDVKCNPVVLSFALIEDEDVQLFIDKNKLSEEDVSKLHDAKVSIQEYDAIEPAIASLSTKDTVLIDPKRNCFAYYALIPKECTKIEAINPSTFLKAVKNETELKHMRTTMVKDGAALTKFFYWLENNIGKEQITEITIAEKLKEFRAQQDGFVGESFDTIAGYKAHGALPHYKATEENKSTLEPNGMLLIDSGGQYTTGTTDITRVISLGNPSADEKRDYTLVLKALIEGSTIIFPVGTKGYQIDAITRRPLWDYSKNYGHGTGHGVGFFLNVHEGPHVFNTANIDIAIEPNMVSSIEPGLYIEGNYGIRIENLVVNRIETENQFGQFQSFETLTLCYIETSLIDKSLLDDKHIKWLNDYHAFVFAQLSPSLNGEELEWFKNKTKAI
ncbi:aminopeptidase P family protein [Albibacterium profundi]|uniref:Aminopeptidase P family protein n=1 Tax=Albibacterium profundi TaxID=3134906 RepID=A0ABV5CAR2_9SPHI